MQSRTQRRRYGEPVARLSLSIRYGQRHVPQPFSPRTEVMESGTVYPYRKLRLTWPSLRSGARSLTLVARRTPLDGEVVLD